jgi:hypothetical protein
MAPELPTMYSEDARHSHVAIPVSDIQLAQPRA